MPKTDKNGQPVKEELPGTIKRSPAKAQRTFAEAHDHAARARELGVRGRSEMSKEELARAIARKQG